MNWNQKTLKIFNLEDFEIKILQSLFIAKRLNDIAQETGIIRTTVAYNLKGLIRRGLVRQVKFGKRYRYIAISSNELSNELQNIVGEIQTGNLEKKGVRVKTNKQDEFVIHVGPQEIIPTFKRIAEQNKNERIKAIQHHKSFNDQVEIATPAQISSFNSAIIKNNIIIEGILNESAYNSYFNKIKADPKKVKDVIKTLEGRMADYSVFPDNRFDCHAEIWIFKTTTLIINWQEKVAIEIINSDMTKLIREMYEYVKDNSRKIDRNDMMRKLIQKI